MLFSIIIPTYNRADRIRDVIQSVLDQEYNDFELIIVDDGSTDHSKEIVEGFIDSRIVYFKKKNEERNIARNYGINKAKGDYISFLDSDDKLYPNHLQSAHLFIFKKQKPNVIHLNFELKNKDKVFPSFITLNKVNNVNEELIKENILHCNSIFIRRDTLVDLKFLPSENAIVGEDHYLWLCLASRYTIHLDNTVTNVVVEHPNRSLNKINLNKLIIGTKEIVQALNDDAFFLKTYNNKGKYFFAFKYTFVALIANDNQEYRVAFQMLLKAIKYHLLIVFSKRYVAASRNALLGMIKKRIRR